MQHQSVFKLHPVRLPVEPPLVSGHKADVAQAATMLLASSPGHSPPPKSGSGLGTRLQHSRRGSTTGMGKPIFENDATALTLTLWIHQLIL